ncbi:MAG: RNA polymerase sigma factor, partial [Bacteroidota bacterium]
MNPAISLQNNEEQFIAALVRGNREAQRLLYEEHYGALMSVCQRYAGSEDEAMDLLHESFIKIFKKIGRYESGTALLAWMRRITVNTAIDHYRRNSRRRTEDLDKA